MANATVWCFFLGVALLSCSRQGSLAQNAATYYLYTSANPERPQQLPVNNQAALKASNFNAALPTKLIIHGWFSSYRILPNPQLRAAYLARGKYNIISMDWSAIASRNYVESKAQLTNVGADCARFVQFLVASGGLNLSKLLVIGHSLGAHAAGFCGKQLQLLSKGSQRLPAIVALDAARPLFNYDDTANRLATSDAAYVMCLHTNGMKEGEFRPLGHADFYANGGKTQPGCGLDLLGFCAHTRSAPLFAEAVRGKTKYTPYKQCPNYAELFNTRGNCKSINNAVELGDPLEQPQARGIYTFVTNARSPYGH